VVKIPPTIPTMRRDDDDEFALLMRQILFLRWQNAALLAYIAVLEANNGTSIVGTITDFLN
jgi:hypothetical protein